MDFKSIFIKYLNKIIEFNEISDSDKSTAKSYLEELTDQNLVFLEGKRLYRFLSKIYHPDTCAIKNLDSTSCFQEINLAYEEYEKSQKENLNKIKEDYKIRIKKFYSNNASNKFQNVIKFIIDDALNEIDKSNSSNDIVNAYENFKTKYIKTVNDIKTNFFETYKISKDFDFIIDISMSIKDIEIKLEQIKIKDINKKVQYVSEVFDKISNSKFQKLSVLLDALKYNYISMINDEPISIEELSNLLSSECEDILQNYNLYLKKVDSYENMCEKYKNVESLYLKDKLDYLKKSIIDDNLFYKIYSKLSNINIDKDDICSNTFIKVTENYNNTLLNSKPDLDKCMQLKNLYDTSIELIQKYRLGFIGMDSMFELENMFTLDNNDLLNYISGRENSRSTCNPDLIKINKGILDDVVIYSYENIEDRNSLRLVFTTNCLAGNRDKFFSSYDKKMSLTTFLSTADFVGTEYTNYNNQKFYILYKLDDIVLIFNSAKNSYEFELLKKVNIDTNSTCHKYLDDRQKVCSEICNMLYIESEKERKYKLF